MQYFIIIKQKTKKQKPVDSLKKVISQVENDDEDDADDFLKVKVKSKEEKVLGSVFILKSRYLIII